MPANIRPYEPPQPDVAADKSHRGTFRITQPQWLLLYLYPLVLVVSFYGTWLLAWWELGHMPRPNVDDPKSIGGVISLIWFVPMFVALPFPIMLPFGFISSFYLQTRAGEPFRSGWWWLWPVVYVLMCMLTFWIIRWDPLRVVDWYHD